MGVSKKYGYPQIIHFNRVFHYKPSILGYPYFWKHPNAHLPICLFGLYYWTNNDYIVCAILCFSSSANLNFRFLNTPGWQPICTRYYTFSKTRSRTLNHNSKCTCLWSLKNKSWICLPFSKFWKLLSKNAPIPNSWWFQPFVSNIVQVFSKINISPPLWQLQSWMCWGNTTSAWSK